MTSAGRLLSGSMKYGDRTSLADGLRGVLDAYAKLPEEARRPSKVEGEPKPVPAPPPGGLVLTIYDRPIVRDARGEYRLPKDREIGADAPRLAAPAGQRSSLWLTADECRSLIPRDAKVGQTLTVDDNLTRRILIYGLWPNSLWVVETAWLPDSMRQGELRLTVESVTEKSLRLRIAGHAMLVGKSAHEGFRHVPTRYDTRLEGVIEYDRAQERIARWDMVSLGDYTGEWFAEDGGRWREAKGETPLSLAFAFEIDHTAYEVPPSRRRPRSFVHAYIFRHREDFYWNPGKWEADWRRRQR